jgi:hypothetical protein
MRSVPRREAVSTRSLVQATLLLVGILVVGYGYFDHERFYLFAGVLLIAGTVLSGVVDLLTGHHSFRSTRAAPSSSLMRRKHRAHGSR